MSHGDPTDHTYENFIVGNQRGLEVLKDCIDEALQKGTSCFDQKTIEFIGVRLVQDSNLNTPEQDQWKANLFGFGCLILIGLVLFFAAVGLLSLL